MHFFHCQSLSSFSLARISSRSRKSKRLEEGDRETWPESATKAASDPRYPSKFPYMCVEVVTTQQPWYHSSVSFCYSRYSGLNNRILSLYQSSLSTSPPKVIHLGFVFMIAFRWDTIAFYSNFTSVFKTLCGVYYHT